MGCGYCYSRKGKIRNIINQESFENIRDKVYKLIIYLNDIESICNHEIEACIAYGESDCAVLLKQKKMCVEDKKKILQQAIKQIDELKTNCLLKELSGILKKSKGLVSAIEKDPVFSNHIKVVRDNLGERVVLYEALKKFNIDESLVIQQVKELISQYNKCYEIKRFKYRRAKSSY